MVEYQLIPRGIRSPDVLAAMRAVPRHLFVEPSLRSNAYHDHPLPIDEGQTISQPYMVAVMTELLDVTADCAVLEIGTGSGYQTAVLAELARRVYSVERLPKLAAQAALLKKWTGTAMWCGRTPCLRKTRSSTTALTACLTATP